MEEGFPGGKKLGVDDGGGDGVEQGAVVRVCDEVFFLFPQHRLASLGFVR